MTRYLYIFASLILMESTALVTHANENNNPSQTFKQSPLSSIYACKEITDSDERLACYDAQVDILRSAEKNKEIVAIDIESAKQIKREAFGFSLPSLSRIGLPKIGTDEKIDSVTLSVKSVRTQGSRYIITLDNGQVWKEVGGHQKRIPKGTLTATIKPKSLGSFMLTLNNSNSQKRSMRAKRIK